MRSWHGKGVRVCGGGVPHGDLHPGRVRAARLLSALRLGRERFKPGVVRGPHPHNRSRDVLPYQGIGTQQHPRVLHVGDDTRDAESQGEDRGGTITVPGGARGIVLLQRRLRDRPRAHHVEIRPRIVDRAGHHGPEGCDHHVPVSVVRPDPRRVPTGGLPPQRGVGIRLCGVPHGAFPRHTGRGDDETDADGR